MKYKYGTALDDSLFVSDPTITHIHGLAGNDWINAVGNGAQALFGDGGNDHLIGGFGNDTIDGGSDLPIGDDVRAEPVDSDTVSYAYGNAITVDLAAGSAVTHAKGMAKGWSGPSETDVLIDIENVMGSQFNDRVFGDSGANILNGNAGDDEIRGGNGDDALLGGSGMDTVHGDAGNDLIHGGADRDSLHDGAGSDTIHGEAGNDLLYSDAPDFAVDRFYGGDGQDNAFLNDVIDVFDGGAGQDGVGYNQAGFGVQVDLGTGRAGKLGAAMPSHQKLFNVEDAAGSQHTDLVRGNGGANVLSGESGNDSVDGGGGGDLVSGGTGNDTLWGGSGADLFRFASWERQDHDQHDVIADFQNTGGDRLRLQGLGFDYDDFDTNGDGFVTAKDASAELVGGSLVVTLSAATGWDVTLLGVTQLDQGDFLFMA